MRFLARSPGTRTVPGVEYSHAGGGHGAGLNGGGGQGRAESDDSGGGGGAGELYIVEDVLAKHVHNGEAFYLVRAL